MADLTWKDKHVIDLKKQRKSMEAQIEMDKVRYAENAATLKCMSEVIETLEGNKK